MRCDGCSGFGKIRWSTHEQSLYTRVQASTLEMWLQTEQWKWKGGKKERPHKRAK